MIYNDTIGDWKDLQNKVCQIFADIGFETEIEKKIKTVRGTAEIDVFSIDKTQNPNFIYLCECKNWGRKIPQTVIHSFRSIIDDFGAHCGYIISKEGFQKGAIKGVEKTNIYLHDWVSFQDLYESRWTGSMVKKLAVHAEGVKNYVEDLTGKLKEVLHKMEEHDLGIYRHLHSKYAILHVFWIKGFTAKFVEKDFSISYPCFDPLDDNISSMVTLKLPSNMSKREVFDHLMDECMTANKEFGDLFSKYHYPT